MCLISVHHVKSLVLPGLIPSLSTQVSGAAAGGAGAVAKLEYGLEKEEGDAEEVCSYPQYQRPHHQVGMHENERSRLRRLGKLQ